MVSHLRQLAFRYLSHRDNQKIPDIEKFENSREVTCIFYANKNWKDGDGGSLKCFLGAKDDDFEGNHL